MKTRLPPIEVVTHEDIPANVVVLANRPTLTSIKTPDGSVILRLEVSDFVVTEVKA